MGTGVRGIVSWYVLVILPRNVQSVDTLIQKEVGLPLGHGSPDEARSLLIPAQARRVLGSSNLASLSEAGGNGLRLAAGRPLPSCQLLNANRLVN